MAEGRTFGAVARDYLAISKPRIFVLLVVVAWAAMFVAAEGFPEAGPFVAVTIAGALSTASSGAFNNVIERGPDARMGRTAQRPVAAGRITPRAALVYATGTGLLAFATLAVLGLWIAAALTVGAIAYYVVVYTVVLKPTTPQNIVIGGLAGSFPALIGWAGATGGLTLPAAAPAFLLAFLVFAWTPAHFWALALLYKDEYAAADFPMHPIVRGEASTRRSILFYSVLTLSVSLALVGLGFAGWIYLVAAVALGGLLVVRAIGLIRAPAPKRYHSFFFYSIQYLGLLLLALMLDQTLA